MLRRITSKSARVRGYPDKAGATIAVVYRAIAELKLDPNNPRLHSPRQIRQIARSIEAFGFNVPVLIDGKLKVVAGHGRVLACHRLGWTVSGLKRAILNGELRAFRLSSQRLAECL
jgi:ParB-like chromosome segregation protein Spo0J